MKFYLGNRKGGDLRNEGALIVFSIALLGLGYWVPRTRFWELLLLFSVCFSVYIFWMRRGRPQNLLRVFFFGLVLRVLLIGMMPNWSDDVYRFVWDGRIVAQGGNPYSEKPVEILKKPIAKEAGLDSSLFKKLNSRSYYSVYPPVDQAIFAVSSLLGGKELKFQVYWIRAILILFEIGTFVLLVLFLAQLKKPAWWVGWYFLNPLVIIEVTGNLHFEGVMVFFFLLGVYVLWRNQHYLSSLFFALSVGTKLIPLLFFPFLVKPLGVRRAVTFFPLVGILVILFFLPWLDPTSIGHFFNSLDLYFREFEFNASIFYIVRWIGFQVKGYDIIDQAGPVLSLITLFGVLLFAWKGKTRSLQGFFTLSTLGLMLHYFLGTTVHPWYCVPLVAMTVLTDLTFPIVWSGTIVLSYYAYGNGFQEEPMVLFMEYALLVIAIVIDVYRLSHTGRLEYLSETQKGIQER